jgi:hypothetical protein
VKVKNNFKNLIKLKDEGVTTELFRIFALMLGNLRRKTDNISAMKNLNTSKLNYKKSSSPYGVYTE